MRRDELACEHCQQLRAKFGAQVRGAFVSVVTRVCSQRDCQPSAAGARSNRHRRTCAALLNLHISSRMEQGVEAAELLDPAHVLSIVLSTVVSIVLSSVLSSATHVAGVVVTSGMSKPAHSKPGMGTGLLRSRRRVLTWRV